MVSLYTWVMDLKDFLGLLAASLNLAAAVPYFMGMYKGQVHPHVFTWFIWSLLTGIAFAAQLSGNAGPGAWALGVSAVLCFTVATCAIRCGEKQITRSDWLSFITALAAIGLWIATDDAFWAVILVTLIDVLAFWPTFRKSWHKPYEEVISTYVISSIKFIPAFFALEQVSVVTALYPVSLIFLNGGFALMVFLRRRALSAV